VPLPGAEAEVGGLRLRAEGGEDARGRMRIVSLLVWDPDVGDEAQRRSTVDGAPGAGEAAGEGQGGETDLTHEPGLVGARGEEHRG
jgi:hypothetical protein